MVELGNTVYTLDMSTSAFKRISMAGFTFEKFWNDAEKIYCHFTCVCGKKEALAIPIGDVFHTDYTSGGGKVDVAKLLEDIGAVSEQHLRSDGYTEDQIKEIRKAYA